MIKSIQSLFKRINEKPLYEWIISGTLVIVFVIVTTFIELSQWIIIVRMFFNLFGLDYLKYAHLLPFECMYEGENISFVILTAAIIFAILIMIFLWGNENVKIAVVIFEILAIWIAIYIEIWVIAIAFLMMLAGLRFGKWAMVLAFLVAVISHGLFLILRKTAISIRQ